MRVTEGAALTAARWLGRADQEAEQDQRNRCDFNGNQDRDDHPGSYARRRQHPLERFGIHLGEPGVEPALDALPFGLRGSIPSQGQRETCDRSVIM